MNTIPIVNFARCSVKSTEDQITEDDYLEVGKEIYKAFTEVGFVYAKNTGIDRSDVEIIENVTQQFFNLPKEVKEKYKRQPDNLGYVGMEMERPNLKRPGDLKEAYDAPHEVDFDDRWPLVELPQFKPQMRHFAKTCKELSQRILIMLSLAMRLERNFFSECHKLLGEKGNATVLRSLHYPPIPEEYEIKPNQIRLGEHTDYGSFTLLFQDEIGGLQIETTDIVFVDATPIHDTVLINIGDLLQFMSEGKLKSTKHRVLIPNDARLRQQTRRSHVYFVHPDGDAIVSPKSYGDKINDEVMDKIKKKEITAKEYLQTMFSKTY